MTSVTCRPMPLGAEGIGAWQAIFENLSIVAIAINAGVMALNATAKRQAYA